MSRLHINKQYYTNSQGTANRVRKEMDLGLDMLNGVDNKIITFFGSHKLKQDSKYCLHCRKVACELGKMGFAVITGGGPGIMQAANTGAMDAKAPSIGVKATLLAEEEIKEPIYTEKIDLHFMFIRRFILSIKSEALIFYPGGYGTLNELFEFAMLMGVGVVDKVPMICVNKKYWKGLFKWLKNSPLKKDLFTNNVHDLNLIYFVDDLDEIVDIIKTKII